MAAKDAHLMLTNTNEFFEILDYEFHRAARYKNDLTLLFIKLSNLSEIAKNYGQLAATRVFSKIERLIRDNIRASDREFIYGNDELMIILPQTPKEGAHSMVPKLKHLIGRCFLTEGKESRVTITPKFGIASYPHDALTKDGVVKMVDKVL